MTTYKSRLIKTIKLSLICCVASWGVLFLIRMPLVRYIAYNDTDSEPIGFYILHQPKVIEAGKLYSISIPEKYLQLAKKLGYSGDGYLLKEIAAIPGDQIQITESGILINNHLLPNSQAQQTAKNINLHPLSVGYRHKLESNEYWTYGTGQHSFDSRYYGIITRNNIHDNAKFWFNNKGVQQWQEMLHSFWQKRKN